MTEIIKMILQLIGYVIGAVVALAFLVVAAVVFIGVCLFVFGMELHDWYSRRKKKV